MSQPTQTMPAVNRTQARRIAALARSAGRLANSNRKLGYH
jgi:hypothetical protein